MRVASGGGGSNGVRVWMGGGHAVYWGLGVWGGGGGSCVLRSVGSVDEIGVTYDGASLELVSIWASSERCGFLGVNKMSSGVWPLW